MSSSCARCSAPGASVEWRARLLVCEPCSVILDAWAVNLECWVRSLLLAAEEARGGKSRGTGYY